jgi:type I site-specific restriction endonuclease
MLRRRKKLMSLPRISYKFVTLTPEQKARREIDVDLTTAGWLVQDRDDLDLTAGRGIAVRESPMKSGFGFAEQMWASGIVQP